jgi:Zn-dependent protease
VEDTIIRAALLIIPLLAAVTLHEVAHGYAAWLFGDPTAKAAGRLSLNPVRHLDPFGSLILPGLLILSGSPAIFGYAKPVPVNFRNLRDPRIGTIVVSAAGVAVNFACAVAAGLLYQFVSRFAGGSALFLIITQLLYGFCIISIVLGVFNLIPIPPLDGSNIVAALLPPGPRQTYERIGSFGILILLVLLMTRSLDFLITAVISPLARFFTGG